MKKNDAYDKEQAKLGHAFAATLATTLASPERLQTMARGLRSDAHYAYLDGRLKRARELNAKADNLDSLARTLAANQPKCTIPND